MRPVLNVLARRMMPWTSYPFIEEEGNRRGTNRPGPVMPVMSAFFHKHIFPIRAFPIWMVEDDLRAVFI